VDPTNWLTVLIDPDGNGEVLLRKAQ